MTENKEKRLISDCEGLCHEKYYSNKNHYLNKKEEANLLLIDLKIRFQCLVFRRKNFVPSTKILYVNISQT